MDRDRIASVQEVDGSGSIIGKWIDEPESIDTRNKSVTRVHKA